VRRSTLCASILSIALLGAACGISPLESLRSTPPSAFAARTSSFQICSRSVDRYGLVRMARYLGSTSTRPPDVARAFVREVVRTTDGWEPYRLQGYEGCLAGIRSALR
jgi:hypothetical protein